MVMILIENLIDMSLQLSANPISEFNIVIGLKFGTSFFNPSQYHF